MDLEKQLLESGGELTPELAMAFEVNPQELANKVDAYNEVMVRFDMQSEYLKKKAQEISAVAKSFDNARVRLKENMKQAMLLLGEKEVYGQDVKFVLQRVTPSIEIDEEKIPDTYKTKVEVIEVDRKAIRDDVLKNNKQVTGAVIKENWTVKPYYLGAKDGKRITTNREK